MMVSFVAPYVGAWIETLGARQLQSQLMSHPMWVRGLKHIISLPIRAERLVAPYVGAWIETSRNHPYNR